MNWPARRDGSLLWIIVHVLQPDWLYVARYGGPHVAMRSICYECVFSVLQMLSWQAGGLGASDVVCGLHCCLRFGSGGQHMAYSLTLL